MESKICLSSKTLNLVNILKRNLSEESNNDTSIQAAYKGLGFSNDSLSCKTPSTYQRSKSGTLSYPELHGHKPLYPVRQRSAVPTESSHICPKMDRD